MGGEGCASVAGNSCRVRGISPIHPLQAGRLRNQHLAFDLRLPAPIDAPPQAFFKGLLEADLGRGTGHQFVT